MSSYNAGGLTSLIIWLVVDFLKNLSPCNSTDLAADGDELYNMNNIY